MSTFALSVRRTIGEFFIPGDDFTKFSVTSSHEICARLPNFSERGDSSISPVTSPLNSGKVGANVGRSVGLFVGYIVGSFEMVGAGVGLGEILGSNVPLGVGS